MSAREVLDEIQGRAELGTTKHWGGQIETYGAIGYATNCVMDDVPRLLAALRAVLDLHPAQDDHRSFLEGPYCAGDCTTDGNREQWPCPTVRAVTEALDGTR